MKERSWNRRKKGDLCTQCEVREVRRKGVNVDGTPRYAHLCYKCYTAKWRCGSIDAYRAYKGDKCEACDFIPEDVCQLDVDHIDGNRSNNHPNNLQTLCSNCHRLKTKRSGDGIYKKSHA